MTITYKLIGSTVLTSDAFDIIFSGIPATYDNLEMRISGRAGNTDGNWAEFRVWVNDQDNTNAQGALRTVNGNTFTNITQNSGGLTYYTYSYPSFNSSSSLANSFTQAVLTFPNYAQTSYQKSFHGVVATVMSDNSARGFLSTATHTQSTAIVQIGLRVRDSSAAATTFVTGTSVYLYGIKNT